MKATDFDYELPEELIARYPLDQRSESRLLCLSRQTGAIAHRYFKDLPDLLQPGDLLVFNNTRVMPARLYAQKTTGGQCEVLIERLVNEKQAWAHVRASKAPKPGTVLLIADNTALTVKGREEDLFLVESEQPLTTLLMQQGHMPLPPYLQRADEALDQERYQTVYAKELGAVAAPTAGLHFDETILEKLKHKGIESAYLTLHVGAGTFQPVRVENILDHKMHYEYAEVPEEVCKRIAETKTRGHRVIAIGTTSARSLETAALSGKLQAFRGETNLFIYPGFKFQVIDGLLTNFHLPKSTLLMLIAAFAGREQVLAAYQAAIAERYRFFSYGDAMLIL
jgi:S-adenosylmethionine:tRNA ribosyltransferase-isomerase